MKVLVTGGSGFIGSHVVDKLIDAGPRARRSTTGSRPAGTSNVATVVGELDDLDDARRARCAGCGAVMHLAAAADVNEVAKEPVDSEACNARGTLMVLEAARAAEVGARRLREHDLGLHRRVRRAGRRGHPAADARPPLHGLEARGRDVLHELRRAVRRRDDDPALRHPLRAARAAGRGRPGVRRQGARRRAADGRRAAATSRGASSTSRTSPTAASRRSPPSRPTASTTSSATSR